MKKAGLRFKILMGLALISFCAMSLLILTLRSYLTEALEEQLARRGIFIAQTIAEQSITPILTRNILSIDLMLHEYKNADDDLHYIFITDNAGEVVSHTFQPGFPVGFRDVYEKDHFLSFKVSHIIFGKSKIIDISVPVMKNNLGHLHVGMSHDGITREIRTILYTVSLVITILFMFAAIAMWLYLERVAMRPIKALGEQVRMLGEGNFNIHADDNSTDELGILGRAFNDMGKRLDSLYTEMSDRSIELENLNEKLEELATTDGLTGLYNHRHFYDRLTAELKRARRYQHPLTLIMADIDHFKNYNDTLGHVAGDKVLRLIAGIISENARENDLVARYGGEEIAIILPETTLEVARIVAERMRSIIESSPSLAEIAITPECPITMSFGVALLDDAIDTPKGFVRLADSVLYRAKNNGRNRVES